MVTALRSPDRLFRFAGLVFIFIFSRIYSQAENIAPRCNAGDSRSMSEIINRVNDIDELLRAGGVGNSYGTGDRFTKEVLLLVHDGTPECLGKVDTEFNKFKWLLQAIPDHYAFISVDGNHADPSLLSALKVPSSANSICPYPVAIKRRANVEPEIQLFEPLFQTDNAKETIEAFFSYSRGVNVVIVNDADFPVDITYIDLHNGDNEEERIVYRSLEPGVHPGLFSFQGTILRVRKNLEEDMKADSMPEPLNEVVLQHDAHITALKKHNCNMENCGLLERPQNYEPDLEFEEERQHQLDIRAKTNAEIIPTLPKFTKIGFTKLSIPTDIMDMLLTYFHDNKESPTLEKWQPSNIFTNHIEAPTYMLHQNTKQKKKIYAALKPILEEWSGVILEPTALYGIRSYTNASWLANHIDTLQTHVLSAIMNVAQDVDEDWSLNIFDHNGTEYNVTLKPGDLLLYESATCIHGRPSPFQGKFFANIFSHFIPVNKLLWPRSRSS
eukprot:482115_1